MILIRHPDITRREIASVLCRRWPDAILRDEMSGSPCWAMSVPDVVELARARRGFEPLRVIILAQRVYRQGGHRHQPLPVAPMPIVLSCSNAPHHSFRPWSAGGT
jgi:hypothetical protein